MLGIAIWRSLLYCGNVDSCVGISQKTPSLCEELAIISNPLGSLCPNSKLLSNGPDGSPLAGILGLVKLSDHTKRGPRLVSRYMSPGMPGRFGSKPKNQ
ncbi:hypothetical protein Nepgr_002640 [Nepenthes gracilis]|uniref:Uncharacterized protein n=1 Tax=Nepenthes gracilis TaxID=150966 RepID=A0AAD3RYD9_NEPGR|nr:hypothetical protein Nepgr_002640 [Nepenthes gracilis]